jgi:hypothetical protein
MSVNLAQTRLKKQPAPGQSGEHYEIRFAERMREFWN